MFRVFVSLLQLCMEAAEICRRPEAWSRRDSGTMRQGRRYPPEVKRGSTPTTRTLDCTEAECAYVLGIVGATSLWTRERQKSGPSGGHVHQEETRQSGWVLEERKRTDGIHEIFAHIQKKYVPIRFKDFYHRRKQ